MLWRNPIYSIIFFKYLAQTVNFKSERCDETRVLILRIRRISNLLRHPPFNALSTPSTCRSQTLPRLNLGKTPRFNINYSSTLWRMAWSPHISPIAAPVKFSSRGVFRISSWGIDGRGAYIYVYDYCSIYISNTIYFKYDFQVQHCKKKPGGGGGGGLLNPPLSSTHNLVACGIPFSLNVERRTTMKNQVAHLVWVPYVDLQLPPIWSHILVLLSLRWTHRDRVMQINCVNRRCHHCSNTGFSPARRHAIIRSSAGFLLIWSLGTIFSDISFKIQQFHPACLQEAWLTSDADVTLFDIPGYKLIHQDSRCTTYGGRIIYLHEKYCYEVKHLCSSSNIWEVLFIYVAGHICVNG